MSHRARIIPVLLLQNGGLVKTEKFSTPRYVGDPINAIKIFNEKEVDEIAVLDIEASKKNSAPNFELIREFASECFMPLAYGGAVKSLSDIEKLVKNGVEKVIINSAALQNPSFIGEATKRFASSTIVVSVDVSQNFFGKYFLYSSSIKKISFTLSEYIRRIESEGAGEILLQAVHRDGTGKGFDTQLISEISKSVSIPLIACGGASSVSDLKSAISAGASAAAAGSFFVFTGKHKAVLISFPSQSELTS
ncbi:MAG TPA: imidazole glycerol phosphate synthase subunit HisF [Bacteroidetes bacterium]|nr:imidazole glycerol phosphate synthase subunit HisF [Bacteroidota bacterium]